MFSPFFNFKSFLTIYIEYLPSCLSNYILHNHCSDLRKEIHHIQHFTFLMKEMTKFILFFPQQSSFLIVFPLCLIFWQHGSGVFGKCLSNLKHCSDHESTNREESKVSKQSLLGRESLCKDNSAMKALWKINKKPKGINISVATVWNEPKLPFQPVA